MKQIIYVFSYCQRTLICKLSDNINIKWNDQSVKYKVNKIWNKKVNNIVKNRNKYPCDDELHRKDDFAKG